MFGAPETQYAPAPEGGYLAYQVVGKGPVDVVLPMNGGFAIDLIWEEPTIGASLRRLATFSRVIAFDPRGFGSSGRVDPHRVPAIQTWMDDIRTVMDAAGSEQACLLSWSLSAMSVMLFAATYPRRVSSLVAVNAFARFLRNDKCSWGMPKDQFPAYLAAIKNAWGTGEITRTLAPSLIRSEDALHRWACAERLSATPDMVVVPRAFMESDVTSVLPAIHAPALVISRQQDPYVRPEHSRYLASQISGARLVELPGDDNFIFAGNTAVILDEIEAFLTGVRPTPVLDRVLATVLFTDIVGSTEHAQRMGDRQWKETLNDYDELVHRELDRFRGRYIKSTGDGSLATFDGPARAIEAARAIGEAVKVLGIEIRAGLHTGEIEVRGDDVAGLAVHIAARVSGLASGGEILVSRTVTDLVAGSGINFVDRDDHQLKGVPGVWRLFGVLN
jgi:class 3 adenylate cyclase/predicted alpha/beta hydrolase family esterase